MKGLSPSSSFIAHLAENIRVYPTLKHAAGLMSHDLSQVLSTLIKTFCQTAIAPFLNELFDFRKRENQGHLISVKTPEQENAYCESFETPFIHHNWTFPMRHSLHVVKLSLSVAALTLVSSLCFAGGDAAAGKSKAAVCAGCHGMNGISSNGLWPNLAGQKEAYLVKATKDYRSGSRNDSAMSAMAKPLSDTDIEDLAAYFSSLK